MLFLKAYIPYLLLVLCLLETKQLVGQNSQLRAYTIADGLPQSQVYDVVQDGKGFLWLGTQGGGLARFDGTQFDVWNEEDGLLSNYIHTLQTVNDSLFIGTKKGLSIKVKNRFKNFESPRVQGCYPSQNTMYLATVRGVYRFSNAKGLQKVPIHPQIDDSSINDLLFDGEFYWLATDKGLWKLSALSNVAPDITKIEANNFTAVLRHQNKIVAATFDDGVFVMNADNPQDNFLMPEPLRINAMSVHQDELWIATDIEGITVVETENYDIVKRLNTDNGLSAPHIRKVFEDDRNNLWIATSGGGLYKYFQNSFRHYDKSTGLKGNRIYAVHNAKDGIWISSSESGLTKIDATEIHHIDNDAPFFDVKIKTITSDAKGNIWAGSDNRGILFRETKLVDSVVVNTEGSFQVRIDTIPVTRTTNHIIDERRGFPSDWVRKLVVDDDHIWAATYANGIVKFKFDSEQDSLSILQTFGSREGISDVLLKDLRKDPQGRLWFASQKGHLGYIDKDVVTMVDNPMKGQAAIGSLLFHKESLFLGTLGRGIWYANSSDPSDFQELKGAKKLSSKNIYQLIFDNQDQLWAGTERGVDKIELNAANEIVDVTHFGRNDGFLGIETCLNAVDQDEQGNLWFGAIYGLTQHLALENTTTAVRPMVYFTGVEEAYRPIDSLDLSVWTNSSKVLQLTSEQTQLGFSFRTVDLNHPNGVEYRTKLDDTEWSPWGKERKQRFAGLVFGEHTFSVQSRNHRWVESKPIRFQFFIESPLYKKDWFQWAIFGAVVLGLTAIGGWYLRKIRVRNKAAQERLQTQNYLLGLEQKALRLQMNPHFIFNVLNGIKAMADSNPQKMHATINSFAMLLRETLHNSRKETISLEQEVKALRQYIEVEKLMAPKPFTYTISVTTEPSAEEILIPPMLIQPFVENAIRHGILKGTREGVLQIGFCTSKTHLECSILDNGMGIFKSQNEKVKTDHQSMALVVTKERLESIAGADTLRMEEIKNEEGTIGGTKITFAIPLVTDY